MSPDAPDQAAQLRALALKLQRAPRVVRLAEMVAGGNLDEVATEAAASIVDIESSCATLSQDLLPKLRALAPESPQFDELLDDVAEEYRHISYHIANTRLFKHVVPDE